MINGIINVYKEKGFTSFDVVAVMRGIAGQKKVGHTGTLDPDAEGVLPVCLGNATKLCDMLTDKRKEYVATFLLGKRTDTLDISGSVLEEKEPTVSKEALTEAIFSFVGGYDQIPPMYSAKKIDGKKLYDIAREGKTIERKPSHVEIYDIEILDINIPYFTIRVSCGKGTYIRSLGEDIASKCNELSVMTSLKRTKVSEFSSEDALTLSELTEIKNSGKLSEYVKPTEAAFYDLPVLTVKKEYRKFIDNGNKLKPDFVYIKDTHNEKTGNGVDTAFAENISDNSLYRIHNDEDKFVGLYRYDIDQLVPYKMFMEE